MRTLLLVLALLFALPSGAAGQFMSDNRSLQDHAVELAGRLGEWYMTATKYRDAMLEKAEATMDQAREAVRLRESAEQMAVGELGRLGEGVPDWRDYANVCAVDIGGQDVCTARDDLMQQYEGAIDSVFRHYEGLVFEHMDSVEAEINDFVGGRFAAGREAGEQWLVSVGLPHMVQATQANEALMGGSVAISELAGNLTTYLDTLAAVELDGREISSGRAQQLLAELALTRATVEVEIAQQGVTTLDQAALSAADVLARRDARTAALTSGLW